MVDFIQNWANHINERDDLLPKWRERKLNVTLQAANHVICLVIDQTGVHFSSSNDVNGQVHLRSSLEIMRNLFSGEAKLTSLPSSRINIVGNYRNVLFVESLLLLAR